MKTAKTTYYKNLYKQSVDLIDLHDCLDNILTKYNNSFYESHFQDFEDEATCFFKYSCKVIRNFEKTVKSLYKMNVNIYNEDTLIILGYMRMVYEIPKHSSNVINAIRYFFYEYYNEIYFTFFSEVPYDSCMSKELRTATPDEVIIMVIKNPELAYIEIVTSEDVKKQLLSNPDIPDDDKKFIMDC